jgi:hypothetical protein
MTSNQICKSGFVKRKKKNEICPEFEFE